MKRYELNRPFLYDRYSSANFHTRVGIRKLSYEGKLKLENEYIRLFHVYNVVLRRVFGHQGFHNLFDANDIRLLALGKK